MQMRARLSSDDQGWRQNRHDHHQSRARTLIPAACHRSSAPTHRDFADPLANEVTLVIWTNLTVSLDGEHTANALLLKVLDQIYPGIPLAPPAAPTPTTR
jgi:D-alanyl-D-alanine carboxypeptidase